jgi:transposase
MLRVGGPARLMLSSRDPLARPRFVCTVVEMHHTSACHNRTLRRDVGAARRDPGPIPGNCHTPAPGFWRACERIVQAPAPEHLIKSGLPTEAMVASVLCSLCRSR